MIVGILGTIGSGKSTVTRMFVELGAEAIDADRMAHEVLETTPVREALVGWLGESVLGPDGRVDREAVAGRVFADEEALRRLESIVHPEVLRRIEERVAGHENGDRAGTLVLDVPLLARLPLKDRCDFLVYVEAPLPVRLGRVAARGWDAADLALRERLQPSGEEKRRMADFVIANAADVADTRTQVADIHGRMRDLLRDVERDVVRDLAGERGERGAMEGGRSGPTGSSRTEGEGTPTAKAAAEGESGGRTRAERERTEPEDMKRGETKRGQG